VCTIFEDKAYTFADGLKGGFPSVCARGVALHCGAVYFELNLFSEGCMQVGWVDASFTGDVAEVLFIGISFSDFFLCVGRAYSVSIIRVTALVTICTAGRLMVIAS